MSSWCLNLAPSIQTRRKSVQCFMSFSACAFTTRSAMVLCCSAQVAITRRSSLPFPEAAIRDRRTARSHGADLYVSPSLRLPRQKARPPSIRPPRAEKAKSTENSSPQARWWPGRNRGRIQCGARRVFLLADRDFVSTGEPGAIWKMRPLPARLSHSRVRAPGLTISVANS